MNSVCFCVLLLFSVQNDSLCREKFFQKAIEDTTFISTNFLKINIIDSIGSDQRVLTRNQSLYLFLKHTRGIDYKQYQDFILDVLKRNKSLRYLDYPELPHLILPANAYVNKIAKKGKKKFVAHFFKNGVFRFKYQQYFESVVAQLFEYGILVSFGENGTQIITYEANCIPY